MRHSIHMIQSYLFPSCCGQTLCLDTAEQFKVNTSITFLVKNVKILDKLSHIQTLKNYLLLKNRKHVDIFTAQDIMSKGSNVHSWLMSAIGGNNISKSNMESALQPHRVEHKHTTPEYTNTTNQFAFAFCHQQVDRWKRPWSKSYHHNTLSLISQMAHIPLWHAVLFETPMRNKEILTRLLMPVNIPGPPHSTFSHSGPVCVNAG